MKGGHKAAHTTIRKVHFAALMDIRHIQIRVHPVECSQEQSQVWREVRVHPGECFQEQSQVWMKQGIRAEKSELVQSLTKWLEIDITEELQERIKNHLPVQVPSLSTLDYF